VDKNVESVDKFAVMAYTCAKWKKTIHRLIKKLRDNQHIGYAMV